MMQVNTFLDSLTTLITNPSILFWMAITMIIGIVVGALPGLTATMAIAILVGLTYGLSPELTFAIILSVYVGAIYGGSITAIFFNIPGTASGAATALDGYPLAKQGRANFAIGITRSASFIGTLFGLILLMLVAPSLANLALKFTSIEMALLALFGVLVSGFLATPGLRIKGWISAFIGMLIALVGIDILHGTPRFTFNIPLLSTGFAFVPVMIGVFAIPQILDGVSKRSERRTHQQGKLTEGMTQIRHHLPLTLRSGVIGTGVGMIPGAGEDIGAWLSYVAAKFFSKHKSKFGKGSVEGIVAAETGNNAAIGGALVPLLTLSIPGSAPAAVLLGALLLHGVRPGPMLMIEQPEFLPLLGAILILSCIMLLFAGMLVAKLFLRALDVPPKILMPIVAVLAVVGAYAINLRTFDIAVMTSFGLLAYLLYRQQYPMAPLVLGVILGPMIDENMRRSFMVYQDLSSIMTRPIVVVFSLLIVTMVLAQLPLIRNIFTITKQNTNTNRR